MINEQMSNLVEGQDMKVSDVPLTLALSHLLVVPAVRPEARPWGQVLLHTAVHTRREVQLHVKPLLRVALLGGVLVQHHHDLGHVVELADQTDVLHGAAPLLVLALDEAAVREDGEERVDVRLGGEVEPGPHVPAW